MSRLDLRKVHFYQESYRDFEGLASAKAVLLKCRIADPTVPRQWAWDHACMDDDPPELKRTVRSIVLNLVHEQAEFTDLNNVTFEQVVEMASIVREMLTCPEWVEVTDADIEAILNSPDEE